MDHPWSTLLSALYSLTTPARPVQPTRSPPPVKPAGPATALPIPMTAWDFFLYVFAPGGYDHVTFFSKETWAVLFSASFFLNMLLFLAIFFLIKGRFACSAVQQQKMDSNDGNGPELKKANKKKKKKKSKKAKKAGKLQDLQSSIVMVDPDDVDPSDGINVGESGEDQVDPRDGVDDSGGNSNDNPMNQHVEARRSRVINAAQSRHAADDDETIGPRSGTAGQQVPVQDDNNTLVTMPSLRAPRSNHRPHLSNASQAHLRALVNDTVQGRNAEVDRVANAEDSARDPCSLPFQAPSSEAHFQSVVDSSVVTAAQANGFKRRRNLVKAARRAA